MVYVALLRGINVGGKNKVEMPRLKQVFEKLGFSNVKTYINSGNIVFTAAPESVLELADKIETAIKKEFGFEVKTLICDKSAIETIAKALPNSWINVQSMKCDIMFLWEKYNSKKILNELTIKPDLDDVIYVNGALIWRVDRQSVTRSGLMKLVGTDLYRHMTIRNCNTVRKIADMMQEN